MFGCNGLYFKICDKMKLEKVKIKDLISPKYNPRQISEEEMAKLKRSITELGYSEPIVVNDVNNVIISGNQRTQALKELGTEEIEVVYVHEPVLAREKALNIALNKINGEWDNTKLNTIFEELQVDDFDLDLTGFDDFEVQEVQYYEDIEWQDDFDLSDEDLAENKPVNDTNETIICPHCGKEIIV